MAAAVSSCYWFIHFYHCGTWNLSHSWGLQCAPCCTNTEQRQYSVFRGLMAKSEMNAGGTEKRRNPKRRGSTISQHDWYNWTLPAFLQTLLKRRARKDRKNNQVTLQTFRRNTASMWGATWDWAQRSCFESYQAERAGMQGWGGMNWAPGAGWELQEGLRKQASSTTGQRMAASTAGWENHSLKRSCIPIFPPHSRPDRHVTPSGKGHQDLVWDPQPAHNCTARWDFVVMAWQIERSKVPWKLQLLTFVHCSSVIPWCSFAVKVQWVSCVLVAYFVSSQCMQSTTVNQTSLAILCKTPLSMSEAISHVPNV